MQPRLRPGSPNLDLLPSWSAPSSYRIVRFGVVAIVLIFMIICYLHNMGLATNLVQQPSLDHRAQQVCRDVNLVTDQCNFIKQHCQDEEAGSISYLSFYFCDLPNFKYIGFSIIVLWLIVLFMSIGISASDFLCVNLATISDLLGLSQTLAGVTFLAFGNGSPDVFSTWAAFSTHNGSLAVGELIGAAGFITAVVAGSMAVVKPFRVSRKTFIRDASFFTVAAAFSLIFLIDGHLSLWESAVMVVYYFCYVATVLLWHSLSHRHKNRKDTQVRARGHFNISRSNSQIGRHTPVTSLGHLEIPYTDDPTDHNDIGIVGEAHPEDIEVGEGDDDEDDEVDRERFLVEMGEEIRRNHRRTLSRMTSVNQPIRPSLLGVLEFGSVLASLERSRNSLEPIPQARRHSAHVWRRTENAETSEPIIRSSSQRETPQVGRQVTDIQAQVGNVSDPHRNRARAASASALGTLNQTRAGDAQYFGHNNHYPLQPVPITANLAVVGAQNDGSRSPVPTITLNDSTVIEPNLPENIDSSTATFAPYSDSHIYQPGATSMEVSHTHVTSRWKSVESSTKWRSNYRALMPHWTELRQTLFPTLENWYEQGTFAKLISLATVPTVLILTITVPVGYSDRKSTVNGDDHTSRHRETSAYSTKIHSPSDHQSENFDMDGRGLPSGQSSGLLSPGTYIETGQMQRSTESIRTDEISSTMQVVPEESPDMIWKPWLVAIQIFMSPLFLLLAFFADDSNNVSQLSTWIGLLLLASFAIFVIFILTVTPGRIPSWQAAMAFPGFCVSIAWVSLIAGEVVGVLKTVGVITEISDAILGLTIFAVGNSLSDLLANLAITRLGYPVMALSACFGGPMLNILLGIGVGGLSLTIKKAHKHSQSGSDALRAHFGIDIGRSLVISGAGLLLTLLVLLVAVPLNKWTMDRRIGLVLIGIWCATTITNVLLEILS